ncbi:uncharacterized protein C8A04DRAFT_32558 [Dichotomopilus funicola]|uniref:F-box domain-containing protein n=1 Tax=Dichotomopilus funicola TaxID=1934379 RepID=A0AAN6UVE4_9PEZI|nr:hypothetical protein C8A04DRAFT_32558 [Dichotomopilus funicola]
MPTKRETIVGEGDSDLEPVEDLTQPLALRSKRTERQRRRREKRAQAAISSTQNEHREFLDLPLELFTGILYLLRPSDILALSGVNRSLRAFLLANESDIVGRIVQLRYPILERCLIPPVPINEVDPEVRLLLQSPDRSDVVVSPRSVLQNIPLSDNTLHCTCVTCMVRWTALCAAVDFAHWQDHLDNGVPIPTVPRGTSPPWNQDLLARNRRIVLASLSSPLQYARILEAHLDSTMRSIRRHSRNTSDRRPHYRMSDAEMRAGADSFLSQEGPHTVDYPYSRELYYMLEVFLPGRSWIAERQEWVYMAQEQWHEWDLRNLVQRAKARRHEGPHGGRALLTEVDNST